MLVLHPIGNADHAWVLKVYNEYGELRYSGPFMNWQYALAETISYFYDVVDYTTKMGASLDRGKFKGETYGVKIRYYYPENKWVVNFEFRSVGLPYIPGAVCHNVDDVINTVERTLTGLKL